jgi:glycosyltransferase involved in cell wall biosynthesis
VEGSAAARPLVSIVVPSYNQGRFIEETLRSCLDQDYRPLEVLVIDGASTDGTREVLGRIGAPELRWWSEPDGGVVDAVNRGLARARGEIVGIQSSDDLYLPGAVGAAVAALRGDPALGLVYGDVELIDAGGTVVGADVQGPFDLDAYLGRLMYVPQPGTFVTRRALEAAGGWREEVSYAADADLWLRIAVRLPVRKLDRVVGRYRYHPAQRDRQRERIARDWERAVRDLIACGALGARAVRHARMGIGLARHRYAAEGDWRARTAALYRALLANPAGVLDPRFPRRDLLPAREPLWRLLSRVKRRLGFAPRSA